MASLHEPTFRGEPRGIERFQSSLIISPAQGEGSRRPQSEEGALLVISNQVVLGNFCYAPHYGIVDQ